MIVIVMGVIGGREIDDRAGAGGGRLGGNFTTGTTCIPRRASARCIAGCHFTMSIARRGWARFENLIEVAC